MAYTSIKTADLKTVKLSDTTKQTFANINDNSTQEETRATNIDAKFEALEGDVATLQTGKEDAFTDGSATIASVSSNIVTLKAGVSQSGGAIANSSGSDITLAKVAKTGAYGDLSGTPTIGNGTLTIQAAGVSKGTFTANQTGDTTINITAGDLGLSSALRFIGITTSNISDGSTTNPITINSANVTAQTGDVVIKDSTSKEFLWNGTAWEELGDESSFALNSVTVTGTGALGGGGALSSNQTITHNSFADNSATTSFVKVAVDSTYGHVKKTDAVVKKDLTDLIGSLAAAHNGTDLSLVTTDEKYVWANKQNALSTQTAYTTKGTSTKVPTITTNTLGQVTAITETDIAFPVVQSDLNDKIDVLNGHGQGNLWINDYATQSETHRAAISIGGAGTRGRKTGSTIGYSTLTVGYAPEASGQYSAAIGYETSVTGECSIATGYRTKADAGYQVVSGAYNVADTKLSGSQLGTYVELVGNGTADNARSNARSLDWNGNEKLAGDITIGNHTTLHNGSNSDITLNLPTSAGTIATEGYVTSAISAIDQKGSYTFAANNAGWTATATNGVYTLTISTQEGADAVVGKIPFACFNENNEQVMATLSFNSSGHILIQAEAKFAGTVYAI